MKFVPARSRPALMDAIGHRTGGRPGVQKLIPQSNGPTIDKIDVLRFYK